MIVLLSFSLPLYSAYLKVGGDSCPKAKSWEPLITRDKKRL
jgi:hypothetical protein